MSEEEQEPEVTAEEKVKTSLVKYIPEKDYQSVNYTAIGPSPTSICTRCIDYYDKLYNVGLTKKKFPPNCKGHILEDLKYISETDFDLPEDYEAYKISADPVAWAYRYFAWEARFYQEEMMSCHLGDTLIYMSDGTLKPIKDITTSDSVLTYDEKNRRTFPKPVIRHLNNGIKDIYRICLENGDQLECTSDHKIYSWSKCGKLNKFHNCPSYKNSYRSIDEGLTVGDRVFVLNRFNRYGDIDNPDLAKLLGYIVTDGYIKDTQVSFANIRKEYVDEFKKLTTKLFPENTQNDRFTKAYTDKHGIKRQDTWWVTVCGNRGLISFLNSIGVTDKSNRELGILNYAFKFSEKSLKVFINRCWSGDGCIYTHNNGVVELSLHSGNKEFLDKYRLLLRKIGIINSRVYEKSSSNAVKLVIKTVDDILNFFEEVDQIYGKEIESNKAIERSENRIRRTRRRFKTMSRQKIVSIEYIGQETVYDMEIADRHNYFANGAVVHNCTALMKVARCGRRTGKAINILTPIPTPDGWKTMGDLQVGDQVFDDQGKPCNVTFVTETQYNRKCYDVVFSDGTIIQADEDHQWEVVTKKVRKSRGRAKNPAKPIVVTTKDMLKNLRIGSKNEANYAVELAKPIQYSKKELPIDPYLLGVWLGDGSSYGNMIWSADPEIINKIESKGYTSYISKSKSENSGKANAYGINNLTSHLNKLNLIRRKASDPQEKHIPLIYLQSSIEDRLELLKGIMDTDGSIDKRGLCEISLTSKKLSYDIYELLTSLGIKTSLRESEAKLYGRVTSTRYRMGFSPPFDVFTLKRKSDRHVKSRKLYRYITEINEIDSIPVKCIQVDSPSSLYLATKSFIPTHNTTAIVILILWMLSVNTNYSILVVAPFEAQVTKIFDEITKLLQVSPELSAAIKRQTKSPNRIEFMNGSKALGFSSGSKSAARSDKIRGQDANFIVLDEADYLDEADIDAILAILASHPDCGLWASSTPTGQHSKFFQWCRIKDLGFKEFWYVSPEAPNWTIEVEEFFKTSVDSVTYDHEYNAEFGIQISGVFRNDLVDRALMQYSLPRPRTPGSKICIGVDWNGQAIGTHIVVTETVLDQMDNFKYVVLEREVIRGGEFTQHLAVEKIIELNAQYDPEFIYVDAGYGATNVEMLHKYGKSNPASKLQKKVVPYSMGSSIEIRDPHSRQPIKKPAKPFLVNTAVLQLEQNRVVLPTSEDTQILVDSTETKEAGSDQGLVQQMRNFSVERYSTTGLPTYSQGNEHALTAWMLSIVAFIIELSDLKGRMGISIPQAILPLDMPKQTFNNEISKQGKILADAARTISLDTSNKEEQQKKRISIAKGDPKTISKYYGKINTDRTSKLQRKWWENIGRGGDFGGKGRGF